MEKLKKQLANELEHKEQTELREKYLKLQPLSDEIIKGEEGKIIPPKDA